MTTTLCLSGAFASAGMAQAQSTDIAEVHTQNPPRNMEEVIVTSSRRGALLADLPRSALVLDEEALKPFQERGSSVQEILGRTIPGFAPPTTEGSAASLTLRGRTPLFLLDGVPIAGNTNFTRYLDKFDPLTIGRTEVIYGPTSLYGAGATGGVIQLFTRDPAIDEFEIELGTQITSYIADSNALDSDGTTPKVFASGRGRITDRLSIYAFVSYEEGAGVRRADGELLLGRSQFSDDTTYIGKLRYDLTDSQSVTFLYNDTELKNQDRAFEFQTITSSDGTQIAQEREFPATYADLPRNEFNYASFNYLHTDLLQGELAMQLYYSESDFLNPASDTRDVQAAFPNWPGLWQSGRNTEELGGRLQYSRRYFEEQLSVVSGLDYNEADSESLLPISTSDVFEESGLYDAADSGVQTAPYTIDALGVFVELAYDVTDRLTLAGGLRWDDFEFDVKGPFEPSFAFVPGVRPGGEGSADDTSYNIGGTFQLSERAILYGNYSEGFSIPSLGFVANDVAPGVEISDSTLVEPVITESYELGIRGALGPVGYTFAAYTTESEFSATVSVNSLGFAVRERAPVNIDGLEASATWQVTERFLLGGSVTWIDGDVEPAGENGSVSLSTQIVPPVKVLLNPSYLLMDELRLFGQMLYVDDREDAFDDGTDPDPVESYTLFDVGLDWTPGNFAVGLQVTNLFNKDYIPAGEITFIPGRRLAGPGRAVVANLRYSFR
ncbi:MAG: TonB-dependent receptor [Pseudomonadota bacterium]